MNKNAFLIISKHDFELADGAMEGIVEVKKKKPWNHGTKVEITTDKPTKLATSKDGSSLILIEIITLTRKKRKKHVFEERNTKFTSQTKSKCEKKAPKTQ
jgi:hypothetical protein